MKKLTAMVLTLLLLLSLTVPAFAADGKVSYDGNAKKFIFAPGSEYSLTDLFPNFKDVMPGDSLTQRITVRNDASQDVKIKVYMRALGAHADSNDFLSQLALAVQKRTDSQMAYMFDAAANETAQLTDWVCLGTLYSGGEVDLDVTLQVPVTLDSKYQNDVGYLDWEFMVEEFPVEDSDPKPPQTGDSFPVGVLIALLILSAAMLLILLLRKKKSKKED